MNKISKLQLGALTVALGFTAVTNAELIITEYVEGGSNNKAIELTNMGTGTLDLTGYVLSLHSNGQTEAKNPLTLTGELAEGASLVVYNAGAADAFKKPAPQGIESTVTWFNGDDALTLTFNGTIVDSFGQVGTDPGDSWADGAFDTKDKTLRRLASITTGDTVVNDAFPGNNNEWETFEKDTSNGLGCPGVAACEGSSTPTPTPEPEPQPSLETAESVLVFSEYIEGGSNNKAIEIANTSDTEVDLAGYAVSLHSNGADAISSSQSLDLTGKIAAKGTLVIYNSGAENRFKILNGIESTVTWFNGDDGLLLTLNGAVVDSIGQIGTDPGTSWSDGEFNTKDKTLRRKLTVVAGDKVIDDAYPGISLDQWIVFDKDTSDGLGCIGEGICENVETVPEEVLSDDVCSNCPTLAKIANNNDFDDNVYYANALVADNDTLRSAINSDISKNHKKLTYSEVWTVVSESDEDPSDSGKVLLIYSGKSIGKGLNAGLIGNSGDAWNREHVWAKSHGFPNSDQNGYTDAHHLRPADASINSARSNLDFDNGGTALTEAPENKKDENSFEPRDVMKGDVARMMFYMDIRYAGADGDNTPDLLLVDTVETESGSPEFGKLCSLYAWHQEDPVSEWEINRNNVVYEYQGNRNPFIDHPEWVQNIFGAACGDAIEPINMPPVVAPVTFKNSVAGNIVTIAANASDGNGDTLTYLWEQTTSHDITFEASSDTLAFSTPNDFGDTELAFKITVSDGVSEMSETVIINIIAEKESKEAGSLGLLLFLLPLVGMFRRKLR